MGLLADASLLPMGLLSLYFIQAFSLSFPMTAYISWVSDTIHMSPATTSFYYALTFFPWNLKPLYALLSDNVPLFGYHRKSYIVICEVISCVCILLTGLCVRSVTGAFLVKFLDSACEAFTQMMLGIVLVDVASGDREKSSNVQSWANAAKNGASIVALLAGIPVYAIKDLPATTVITWSSLIPLLGVLIAIYLLHENKSATLVATPTHHPSSLTELLSIKWLALRTTVARMLHEQAAYIPVMVFFFLCSALPSGGTVWYQYTYFLLKNELQCLQYSSLAGMVGRVVSCAIYARCTRGVGIRTVFGVSTVLMTLASLPQLLLAPPIDVASLPVDVCTFCAIESFVTAFAGEFALLQLLVVATTFCPRKKELHGLTYALYLSFMDFGGVVSAFFSALLVSALGITQDPVTYAIDYSNLWLLLVLGAIFQVAILAFLCLLPRQLEDANSGDEPEAQALLAPSEA
ncbi:hypothetical protein SPRG_06632 [Saprolegnia parasitica CBS 223.65]|uniref:Uncharacterized protein n=1 Tax=Saprolegnia parasitica (strain CBS 223.65) TaxID=695850 RepID=A0A067CCA4_SAPPC|nr:hypothetical protein SPRG_06632 [Saprolegnia parasitica CBS 223.65]KDO28394.1 hypothetical protein SPRG_06632 [Saprolegnia parasitica CBS 223.65]|eukprot:XP_012200836.1 hypothetical protein SPRG_06632 [Saprolegnia parasitica CBS 223.65]